MEETPERVEETPERVDGVPDDDPLAQSLSVAVRETGPCARELRVEVAADRMREEVEEALVALRRRAKLPGFRPGHVPLPMLRAHLGKDLLDDVKESVVSRALSRALVREGLRPVAEPNLDQVTFEEEGPLTFTARLEVEPEIAEIPWKGLKVRRPRVEVNDSEVEAEVNRLRETQAEFLPVERGAEPGDLLVIDYERCDTEDPQERGRKITNLPVQLGAGVLFPEMEQGLTGAVSGTTRRISIRYPEDYSERDLAGREIAVEVSVQAVKEKRLPPLSDDFARAVSSCATMDELRQRVTEAVRQAKERAADRQLAQSLFEALVVAAPCEAPPTLVAGMHREMLRDLASRQGTGAPAEPDPQLATLYQRVAEREVKRMFLVRELARREAVRVSAEEVEERIGQLASELARVEQQEPEAVAERLRTRETAERVAERILEDKVVGLLREHAVVEEGAPL